MVASRVADKAAVSAGTVLSRIANGTFTTSLVDLTRPCRVNPIVAVDKSLENYENLPPVLHSSLSIFAAYYLLAFNIVGNINSIRTMQVIDQLNPHREVSISTVLPVVAQAIEDYNESPLMAGLEDKETVETIYAQDSLAVGKLLYVSISPSAGGVNAMSLINRGGDDAQPAKEEKPIQIPILVTVSPAMVPTSAMVHMMEMGSGKHTTKNRLYMAAAGQISWIKDFLLDEDLLKKYEQTLIEDTSGIFKEMVARRGKNRIAGAISNRMSLGECSNIFIISRETEKEINREISGRISDFRTRQRIFNASFLMFIIVVDTKFEEVEIYYRGMEQSTKERIKDLTRSEKGKGADIGELMEAFLKSNVPAL